MSISVETLAIAKKYADAGGGSAPQKGVDYWTEEDKQEIVEEVLAEIPDGNNIAY